MEKDEDACRTRIVCVEYPEVVLEFIHNGICSFGIFQKNKKKLKKKRERKTSVDIGLLDLRQCCPS